MLGRAAYHTPYILAEVDDRLFADAAAPPSRAQVLQQLMPYIERHLARGGRLNNVARHLLGLYHGQPRARAFRRYLSENAVRPDVGVHVLSEAMSIVEAAACPVAAAE
jgi:tRNA-dihydrouridine synthase A